MTASAPTPTRGLGALPSPAGRAPPLCFSALPAIWATPFLLASPMCKMLLCPPTQCSGVPKTKAWCPGHQGLPGGSLLTPGMPFVWTTLSTKKWASYNLLARTLTSRNQDSPRGHCPTSWAPHVTNSTTIAPAPFVQGEGVVSLTSPSPPPGTPPGKGAFGQPLDLVRLLQPQPTLPSALHRRAGCAGATSLTMFLPALLSHAKLGARSRD